MALKRLDRVAETVTTKSKDEIPVIEIPGRLVSRFNAASQQAKEAKATLDDVRAKILEQGLKALFEINTEANEPVTSIKLLQKNEAAKGEKEVPGDGEIARLSFQERYSAADPDTVSAVFSELGADVNEFMQETVTASFDSKIFNTGSNGEFDQKVFDAYSAAIQKVTDELVKKGKLPSGTKSPLGVSKKVLPLANFHKERWTKFPTPSAQMQLFEVVSNTVTLTPVKS